MTEESVRIAAVAVWNEKKQDKPVESAFKDGFDEGVKWLLNKAVHWPWPQVFENLTEAHKRLNP